MVRESRKSYKTNSSPNGKNSRKNSKHNGYNRDPIAIIGLGCRFPGANNIEEFWNLLKNGVDAITEVPPSRFPVDEYYYPQAGVPGKICTKWGGFLEDIEKFDPYFFGISPREANSMDPQQRLLLEVSWEALEDAGQKMEILEGSPTGVFMGMCTCDYGDIQTLHRDRLNMDLYSATGTARSVISGRVSYALKLEGPSFMTDTACSSSLLATHLACQSILSGESDMAIAGGVSIILTPGKTMYFSTAGMMALDGRSKAFDARADGYVRSEGIGVVVLKRLSSALEDGDPIHAVIRGGAVNNDGYGTGIMTPKQEGQEACLRDAFHFAGITPRQIHYIEAHGTGTAVGDPVEASALGTVLGEEKTKDNPCIIGSVKTNIGHTEAAAGVAGLIKAALCLKHRAIPPSLHFNEPNPNIPWDDLPIKVQTEYGPWPVDDEPAIAGVNSFGISGTNVHIVLEEPPRLPSNLNKKHKSGDKPILLTLSAHNEEALQEKAVQFKDFLSNKDAGASHSLYDIGYTSNLRRTHHEHRLTAKGSAHEEIAEKLDIFANGERIHGLSHGTVLSGTKPKLVFVCSPTGSQWHGMGLELYNKEPAFRDVIEKCDKIFRKWVDWSLIEELHAKKKKTRIDEMVVVQPILFALQVGLAELWRSWGVVPDAIVGHSLGEIAASHISGILSLEHAAQVICNRSVLVDERASGKGGMAIVELPIDEVREIASAYEDHISIAASNSPVSTVVSGYLEPLLDFQETLEKRGVFCRLVNIAYASHSPQMDPILDDFHKSLKGIKPRNAKIPMFSTVTATKLSGKECNPAYWTKSLRDPVYYQQALDLLVNEGHEIFIELSPHPVLSVSTAQCLSHFGVKGSVLPSLRQNEGELDIMLNTMGELYTNGYEIDWSKSYPEKGRCISLPSYPWQNETYWLEGLEMGEQQKASHPFLERRISSAKNTKDFIWETDFSANRFPYLGDHQIQNTPILPATAYIEIALAAASEAFGKGRHSLENASYIKPLFLQEKKAQTVQVVVTPEMPGAASFQIFSRLSNGSGAQEDWNLHSEGTIRIAKNGKRIPLPEHQTIKEIKSICPYNATGEKYYEDVRKRGLNFGPSFKGIDKLWLGQGVALGRMKIPEIIKTNSKKYVAHPAILDSCLQVLTAALALTTENIQGLYLPVASENINIYGDPKKVKWVYAVFRERNKTGVETVIGDVYLLNSKGKVLMEMLGKVNQLVGQTEGAAASSNPENWLYNVNFIPSELPKLKKESTNGHKQATRGKWLILADAGNVAKSLSTMFSKSGYESVLVTPGSEFKRSSNSKGVERYEINPTDPDDLKTLLDTAFDPVDAPCKGIAHLWGLDLKNPNGFLDTESMQNLTYGGILNILHTISEAGWPEYPRLWIVTNDVHAVGADSNPPSISQSPLWGLGRVVANEHPEYRCSLVDLSANPPPTEIKSLFREFVSDDKENQLALRSKKRYVARLERFSDDGQGFTQVSRSEQPFHLEISKAGILDNLILRETGRQDPGPGEVEIEVHAAGLNFIDLMIAMGIYPGQPEGPIPLGTECSGKIVSVGKGVKDLKIGDEVIALAHYSFATHTIAPEIFVTLKPKGLSFEEAATIPNVYLTAYYALHHLGRMREGEKVLIHSASGGVGQAAVQLAQRVGAEIFATAGREEKQEFLKTLGIKHVMNSRTLDFADEIMETTDGEGVDIVLNSLSGEAIPKGLSVLAPYGRFLEIGKRDIYEDSRIGLLPFKNSISMFAIDLARMFAERSPLLGSLFKEMMQFFEDGSLKPLPYQTFPISEASDAFRFMAQAKHIGKIILTFNDEEVSVAASPDKYTTFKEDGAYLITGGLGGLGLTMAKWLVGRGAGNLALMGRSGASKEASVILNQLKKEGAKIKIFKADVSNLKQMTSVFDKIGKTMPPLRGIIHAAGVLDDGILLQMNNERFRKVMAPKVEGAWNLHVLSLSEELDFFTMFSSVASIMGSPGQGNYSSANAFMDSLAHYRHAKGLPALSINWGPWAEVGMAATPETIKNMEIQGIVPFTPEQGAHLVELIMSKNRTQVMPLSINWSRLLKFFPSGNVPPILSTIADEVANYSDSGQKKDSRMREKILSAKPEEQPKILESFLKEMVAGVLGIPTSRLDINKNLMNMGLDSLMGLELKNRIEANLGIDLPVTTMLQDPSVSRMIGDLIEQITKVDSDEIESDQATEMMERVEELSEEDVKAMLEEKRQSL